MYHHFSKHGCDFGKIGESLYLAARTIEPKWPLSMACAILPSGDICPGSCRQLQEEKGNARVLQWWNSVSKEAND